DFFCQVWDGATDHVF
nr:immunoglobulin light chain junction region [Macaca mulatta]